jgi:hypothetical protein
MSAAISGNKRDGPGCRCAHPGYFEVEAFDDKRRIGEGHHAHALVHVESFTKRLST